MNKQQDEALAMQRASRTQIQKIYNNFNFDRLNSIPAGFSNNLIWNAGHVLATMELLTYGLAGLPLPSGQDFIDRYRKGSRPTPPCPDKDYEIIGMGLQASTQRLELDLQTLDFSKFRTYTTSYGVTLNSIEEALNFNNMHEAMHLGTMLALRKLV